MGLTVTVAGVREKAGITGSSYDSKITNLIAAWVPALEFAIAAPFLDGSDSGRQATLDLGATEHVAGELLAQIGREPGASEALSFGWLELAPAARDLSDPFGLKRQGAGRLAPFMKHPDALQGSPGVLGGGSREEP